MATGQTTTLTILTDAKIMAIRRPSEGQIEVRDQSVPGLRIRVGVTGSRTFVLRKNVVGRYRNITLGRFAATPVVCVAPLRGCHP